MSDPADAAAASVAALAVGDAPPAADAKPKKDKPKKEKKAKPAQAPKEKGAPGGGKKKETKLGLRVGKEENFAEWYTSTLLASEMISYYDVSGCYILRPWAYAVWEAIQDFFGGAIKAAGVENAYFPLFVTEDKLNKEKDHVEGFSAEVAWVTKSGSSELERPIAIRPTSETVMYPYFAQWTRSHRDLPLRLNQWTNVVRWEFKHPTPFIRTREFLWQEGHTAFATAPEAEAEVAHILDLYAATYEELLAVPVVKGRKSEAEKFAGAAYTTSVEAYVPAAGRGVQGATSHHLGQNFSKMFEIEFEAEDGSKRFAWQNSWGLSTRSIGVMVMAHGDDKGMVMPPRVAPLHIIAIPIINSKMSPEEVAAVNAKCGDLVAAAAATGFGPGGKCGVRGRVDDRTNVTPGWKYAHWETKGVPLRLEVGARDMEGGTCVLVRRDSGVKEAVAWADAPARAAALLDAIQADLLAARRAEFDACRETATTWDAFMAALDRRHCVLAPWADEKAVEDAVRARSARPDAMGAKTLCIPLDQPPLPEGAVCFASGKPAKNWALWGRSY